MNPEMMLHQHIVLNTRHRFNAIPKVSLEHTREHTPYLARPRLDIRARRSRTSRAEVYGHVVYAGHWIVVISWPQIIDLMTVCPFD